MNNKRFPIKSQIAKSLAVLVILLTGLVASALAATLTVTNTNDKAWKGTCRILVVRLSDGTDHVAKFRFK